MGRLCSIRVAVEEYIQTEYQLVGVDGEKERGEKI